MRNLKSLSVLLLASTLMFTACGSSSKKVDPTPTPTTTPTPTPDNKAPTINTATISMPTRTTATYQVSATDPDGDALTYAIMTAPSTTLSASIDNSGLITFANFGNYGADSMVVKVTDAEGKTAEGTITISAFVEKVGKSFTSQFYKLRNPDTGNYQIVHYNSLLDNPDDLNASQEVIKTDVILGHKVFVMSGHKDGDKTVYDQREYAIFQDPSASSETRTGPDGRGGTFEYTFYFDHILKRFDTANPSDETAIFNGGASLSQDLKDDGLAVIDAENTLFLNEIDIDNSYVELTAYEELADSLRGEKPEEKIHVSLAVRLSDSAHVSGRIIGLIKKDTGTTDAVLLNYMAAHKKGAYPSEADKRKRLQKCDTALNCTDIPNGDGNYFLLAENDSHIYITKDKSNKIFAYDKTANALAEVTGVAFPAKYDHHHHNISLATNKPSHAGFFPAFITLTNARATLSEGNDAYVAINYDLDSKNPVGPGPYDRFGWLPMAFKNAMILKLTGTSGVKVYDNGDGVDHMDNPADNIVDFHVSLTAVKDGNLFIEAAKFNGLQPDENNASITCRDKTKKNCVTYKQGWLHTSGQTTTKDDLDNEVTTHDYQYMMARRVPPVASKDHIYVVETDDSARPSVYNLYKMPLADATLAKDGTGVVQKAGRMYFERSAYRTTGVYDGTVLIWEAQSGNVIDISTGSDDIVIGTDDDIFEDPASIPFSVMGASSTNNTAGYGGLFGLRMSLNHAGEETYLVSGKTGEADSLKKVNRINGSWIVD